MSGTRQIPAGCFFWPERLHTWQPGEVVRMYHDGFAGAWRDDAARSARHVALAESGGHPFASQCTRHLAGSGAGKLSLLFPAVESLFPTAFPGAAQERGDCVSHSSKNAALASLCSEIVFGQPDEITGKREGPPEVDAVGEKNGVLSTEYLYWWRGYNGDGWDCDTAAEMIRKEGMLARRAYPDLGLDLTKYSGRLAGQYGSSKPPADIAAIGRMHFVRTTTDAETLEEIRDLIANGYGISSCGSEGFSDSRDENGVAVRLGSWAHAMPYWGFDDREETHRIYKGPLVLVGNSWGQWNSGPRRIRGTQLDIPHGCFWARWRDVERRRAIAYSSIAGWPARKLPDYGVSIAG
jgi:hypothetical protein